MDRKTIKQLIQASITDRELDESKIKKIAELLTKAELKLYIKALKRYVRENTIVIEVPKIKTEHGTKLQNAFPHKKVILIENPSLLLGMKIQDNDDVYEMNLKNSLEQLTGYVVEGI